MEVGVAWSPQRKDRGVTTRTLRSQPGALGLGMTGDVDSVGPYARMRRRWGEWRMQGCLTSRWRSETDAVVRGV